MRLIKFLHPHPAQLSVYTFDWNNRLSLISPGSLRNALPSHALRKLLSVVMTTGVLLGKTARAVCGFHDWHSIHLAAQCIWCRCKKSVPSRKLQFRGNYDMKLSTVVCIILSKFSKKMLAKKMLARLTGEKLEFDFTGSLCRCCILIDNDQRR